MGWEQGDPGALEEEEEGQVRQRGHWFVIAVFQSCYR